MNDPDRLLESKGSPVGRALLGSLKRDAPSRASKKRALAGAALAATAAHAGHSAASAGTVLLLAKWTAAGALLGGVASGGVVVLNDAQEASTTEAPTMAVRHTATAPTATRVIPTAPTAPAQRATPDPETPHAGVGAQAAAVAVAPSPSHGAATPTSLREQRLVIDSARRMLANGNAAGVLRELDSYDAKHRRQFFAQEAMVLRVEALTRLQQTSRAKALGRRFLRSYPDSPLAKRVRTLTGER